MFSLKFCFYTAWYYEGFNDTQWPTAVERGNAPSGDYSDKRLLYPFGVAKNIWTSNAVSADETIYCRYVIGGSCSYPSFPAHSQFVDAILNDDGNVTANYSCDVYYWAPDQSQFTFYNCYEQYERPYEYVLPDCQCKKKLNWHPVSLKIRLFMLCFCVVDRFSGTGLYVYSELSTSVFFDDELVLETSASSNPATTLIEDVMTSHSRVNIISFRLFASDSEQVDWKMSLHTSNNISSGSNWKCLSSATEPDCKYNCTSRIFRVQSYLIFSRS